MNKKMIIYIIIGVVIVVLILAGVGGYLWYKNNTSSPKVLEYRDFSCPGMTGFTFKYPVFEGWVYKEPQIPAQFKTENSISCNIEIEIPGYEPSSRKGFQGGVMWSGISVTKTTKIQTAPFAIPDQIYKNPQGISYVKQYKSLLFFAPDFYVDIKNPIADPNFSSDLFFKTVIDSFKLTNTKSSDTGISAKRTAPKDIPPVLYKGIKFVASYESGDEVPAGGSISAFDEKTNKFLWDTLVYGIEYDYNLESDVQDVFISKLFIENDRLIIINDKNERFELDPFTGDIFK